MLWVVTSTAGPFAGGVPDSFPQPRAAERPDARGGLVEDQQLWLVGEGNRERDLALRTERKVADQFLLPRGYDGGQRGTLLRNAAAVKLQFSATVRPLYRPSVCGT